MSSISIKVRPSLPAFLGLLIIDLPCCLPVRCPDYCSRHACLFFFFFFTKLTFKMMHGNIFGSHAWDLALSLIHLSAYVPAFRQPNGMDRDLFINGNFCFLLLWTLKMSKNVMERPLLKYFGK